MKTRYLEYKTIYIVGFLLLMLIIGLLSCRKYDSTYAPVYPNLQNQDGLTVFPPRTLNMLTLEEQSGGKEFPGYMHYALGKSLGGTAIDAFKEVGSLLMDIHKDKVAKQEYATVTNDLNNITNQLSTLNQDVINLGIQLQNMQIDISSQLNAMALAADINTISVAFKTTDHTGLIYYAQMAQAAKSSADSTSLLQALDQEAIASYATPIYHGTTNIQSAISGLHGTICNPNFKQSPLKLFVDNILSQNVNIQDSAKAMVAYKILEDFFIYLLNYQNQGLTILCNVDSLVGLPGEFTSYFNGTYRSFMQEEVSYFLKTADYLTVNVSDYRTKERFNADMPYSRNGMAPDRIFPNVIARSRFLANLIYEAAGLPTYSINGTMTVPQNYQNGINPPVTSISIIAGDGATMKTITATADMNTVSSIYPCTSWTVNTSTKNGNCQASPIWVVYNFQGLATDFSRSSHYSLETDPNTEQGDYPWPHTVSPIGISSVNAMWYNPQHPDAGTATYFRTVTNTVHFGCFSGTWYWGYQYLSLSDINSCWWSLNPMDYYLYSSIGPCPGFDGKTTTGPYHGSSDGNNIFYPHGQDGFSYPQQNTSAMAFGLNVEQTSHYCVIADAKHTNVQLSAPPPNSPSAQVWCNYSVNWSAACTYWGMQVIAGTYVDRIQNKSSSASFTYFTGGDILHDKYSGTNPPDIKNVFGHSGNLNVNGSYQPGYEYMLVLQNTTKANPNTCNISLSQSSQILFFGTYNIEQ